LSDELSPVWVLEEDILIVTVHVDIVRVFGILLIGHTDSGIDKRYIMLLVLVEPVDKGAVLCFTG
jgi:hypothetical protein